MKKIYVDMDGVLTDFNGQYLRAFGVLPADVRARRVPGEYSKLWNTFCTARQFEQLDMHVGAVELLEHLSKIDKVQIAILTSSGGFDHHSSVMLQKVKWLCDHHIAYPAIVVPGRRFKAGYASQESFLIDDTLDVIEGFTANGGHGVHHNGSQIDNTLNAIDRWLSK